MLYLRLSRLVCAFALFTLVNCSSTNVSESESISVNSSAVHENEFNELASLSMEEDEVQADESVVERSNLCCWEFNQYLDKYVLHPIARTWMHPKLRWLTKRINQFFFNLQEPVSVFHRTLEGSWEKAFLHFSRFLINSTLGAGGLWDVAAHADPAFAVESQRRLGDTLGSYGVPLGTYFMLPIYGAASVRQDILGFPEIFYNPVSYLFGGWVSVMAWSVKAIELRGSWLEQSQFFPRGQRGYYQFKAAYIQRRAYLASDGQTNEEEGKILEDQAEWFDPVAIDELAEHHTENHAFHS